MINLTTTWENAYKHTIGNISGYSRRLNELINWDKPFVKKENDISGKWAEYESKISALNNLIFKQ